MVILHIYKDRGILLLFYDDQDTASDQWEIKMITFQVIFTHKNISKALWNNDIHTLQNTFLQKQLIFTNGQHRITFIR